MTRRPAMYLSIRSNIMPMLLLIQVAAISCHTVPDEQAERAELEQLLSSLMEADRAGDLSAAMQFYAGDVILMPPGSPSISGKEAVRDHYKSLFENFTFVELDANADEIDVTDNKAWIAGTTSGQTEAKNGSSRNFVDDKFLMLLEKTRSGDWKIERLIWNRNGT
jgi:uncharacterized protein (TIGR02246 family)